jgi:hypothetical protein
MSAKAGVPNPATITRGINFFISPYGYKFCIYLVMLKSIVKYGFKNFPLDKT